MVDLTSSSELLQLLEIDYEEMGPTRQVRLQNVDP